VTNVSQNNFNESDKSDKSDFPVELIDEQRSQSSVQHWVGRWYALTALPDAPPAGTMMQREAVRRSRLSSSVLFFLLVSCASLMIVTLPAMSIYPWYFWLSLELFSVCIVALVLLRHGRTNTAGILTTTAGFLTITASLFSTIPFNETTLQGYDMYILLLLLCGCLLPIRSIFLFYVLSAGVIVVTLFKMPLTPTLQADFQSQMFLILVRPIGIMGSCAGVAYIMADSFIRGFRRANRAETVARLEHGQLRIRTDLRNEINQIVHTQVQVSNGKLSARVPVSDKHLLLQVAQSLNILLVRYQRAKDAEEQLQMVDQTVATLVAQIQRAKIEGRRVYLPWTNNPHLDALVAELQGETVSIAHSGYSSATSYTDAPPPESDATRSHRWSNRPHRW
jgi:hypothetical protein